MFSEEFSPETAARDQIITTHAKWVNFNYDRPNKDTPPITLTSTPQWMGGVAGFAELPPAALKLLIEQGHADPEDAQNEAPTTAEFLAFAEANPGTTLHGYVTGGPREHRLSVEGISRTEAIDEKAIQDFLIFAEGADTIHADRARLYCWYD